MVDDSNNNYFFVVLPSNVTDYVDNTTSKYRVHLPKPIQFRGSWVCGLYSIQYPHSWASTIGTVEDQWIDIHYIDGRQLRVHLPKSSQLRYLNGTLAAALSRKSTEDGQAPSIKRSKRSVDQEQPQSQEETEKKIDTDTIELNDKGEIVPQDNRGVECIKIGKLTKCKRITPTDPAVNDNNDAGNSATTIEEAPTNFEQQHVERQSITPEEEQTQESSSNDLTKVDDDDSSNDEGEIVQQDNNAVECRKIGRLTKCKRIKPIVTENGDKNDGKDEEAVTDTKTSPEDTSMKNPEITSPSNPSAFKQQRHHDEPQAQALTRGEQLGHRLRKPENEVKSQQKTPVNNESSEAQTQTSSVKDQPKTHADVLKDRLSSIQGDVRIQAPPQKSLSDSQTSIEPTTRANEQSDRELQDARTHGEQLRSRVEVVQDERMQKERQLHEAKTHGDLLREELKKIREEGEKREQELSVTKTKGDTLRAQIEKIREESGQKDKQIKVEKTHGNALVKLLEESRKKTEETEKRLTEARTHGQVLTDRIKEIQNERKALSAPADVHFNYRTDIDRFQLIISHPEIDYLSMSSQIAYVLGFPNKERVVQGETAKYGVDLRGGFTSFAVYATGLTRSVILGNSLSSLLRIVSTEGEYGQVVERIYDNPMFIPVHPREINELQVELRMMNGQLVPFDYGTVLVTLVFKKVINF
ncbi:hypothetical protein niasHT_003196 [Heterodera trifolii]|uniref:Uncharacterized protein n=1 Tax=Heterodera trifolii TaxID=157864 RepID=A0ABD2LQ96_9BILA